MAGLFMRREEHFWKEEVKRQPFRYLDSAIDDFRNWDRLVEDGAREFQRIRQKTGMAIGLNMTIYEIGCGAGRLLSQFHQHYERVCGVDISDYYLDIARAHLSDANVDLRAVSNRHLPMVRQGTWDIVFSYQVLHYLKRRVLDVYFSDAYALLSLGGTFIFQFDTKPIRLITRLSWMMRSVLHGIGIREWRGTTTSPGLFRDICSVDVLLGMLETHRFVIERVIDRGSGDTWFVARKQEL